MKIRRLNTSEAPDINFIPLIDVLLVIVIFLVVSTTFVRQSQLKVELPGTQSTKENKTNDQPLIVRIGKDGNYALGDQGVLDETGLRTAVADTLSRSPQSPDLRAVLEADSDATHQSVVTAMDILASLGVSRVSIATASKKR